MRSGLDQAASAAIEERSQGRLLAETIAEHSPDLLSGGMNGVFCLAGKLYIFKINVLDIRLRVLSWRHSCPLPGRAWRRSPNAVELFSGKQQGFVVPGAMENMDDFDRVAPDAVENQKLPEETPANAYMLVARHQRIGPRGVEQRFALFSQLTDDSLSAL